MDPSYTALATLLSTNASSHPKPRYLIAIAGAPGSGKTTLATAVVARLNTMKNTSTQKNHVALLMSMDGFHLPRSTLDALPSPQREEAYIRRGAPWTFDAEGFGAFMRRLRGWADSSAEDGEGGILYGPTFSHATKDPVPDSLAVTPETTVVIVEGNYLLLDEDGWREIPSLVDYRVFVDVDLQEARGRLARRHLNAGIEGSIEDGLKRVDANDYVNGVMIRDRVKWEGVDFVVKSVADVL
ncbi:P-loop containing nucleoside triphosphate hydrolase protein [Aspergillus pseudoustus]|uniref:P-loop containing nucleoside triphosphate hydrolase protein n=1 Tax=Aspergillus pseudoustus TaxID=1810923 RepID=A0ABR4KC97_9EURO